MNATTTETREPLPPLVQARRPWASHGANLLVIVIRVASIGTGLAFVKSYTGALSTAEVGTFFYLSTLSYGINALVFVPFDFYLQARLAALPVLPMPTLRRLVCRVLALGFIACILFAAPLIWMQKLRPVDVPALYAVAALLYLCNSGRNLLNNRGHKVFVSAMAFLESFGRLAAFLAIAQLFKPSASSLMASSALALAVEAAIIARRARDRLTWDHRTAPLDTPAQILRNAAPISGSAVCNAAQLQAYRVAYPLANLGAASGIYGVVSNIGAAGMAACASIFSQIHVPRLYHSNGKSIHKYVVLALTMSTVVGVAATMLAPWLVKVLTKPQYVPYSMAIVFGVVAEACNLIIGGYTVFLSIERRTGLLLRLNILAAALSIGGCLAALYFRPEDPFLIGFSVVASQIFMTLSLLLFARPAARSDR